MRKSLWVVAAMALLGSSGVMAQDQGQRPNDRNASPEEGRGQTRPNDQQHPAAKSRPAARAPSHRPSAPRAPHVGRRPAHRFLSGGTYRRSIHAPAFRYPSGFAYRVWTTGSILPPVFLTAPYFYDDYAALGLAAPPGGYRWVRYGPDLLLVNIGSGRIADSVDGVFY